MAVLKEPMAFTLQPTFSSGLSGYVAEIGNCMTCARLGLTPDFDQSGAYVQSWLRAMADDKRLIFKAASEAQKAAEWLMKGQQIEAEEKRAA